MKKYLPNTPLIQSYVLILLKARYRIKHLPTNLHFRRSSKWVQNISPLSFGMYLTNSGCVISHSCCPFIVKLVISTFSRPNSFTAHCIQCLTCTSVHWIGSGNRNHKRIISVWVLVNQHVNPCGSFFKWSPWERKKRKKRWHVNPCHAK